MQAGQVRWCPGNYSQNTDLAKSTVWEYYRVKSIALPFCILYARSSDRADRDVSI